MNSIIIFWAICSFFIIIQFHCKNKCFLFYLQKSFGYLWDLWVIYEHLCSNLQFISLPEEVGEFLLYHVKSLKLAFVKNKADKSTSNSLHPSIFEELVTLCVPDAVCFSRHIPPASGHILAEHFCFIGTLRSNFL